MSICACMRGIRLKILFFAILLTRAIFLFAQSQSLHFDSRQWNFGEIAEEGGKVEHTFTFENTSAKPIVILGVRTGCGCTTSQYSRKPIAAGERGEFKVVFDPMNRPGKFTKDINITTSEGHSPISLRIEGVVMPRRKSVEELYPFELGGGVRLSANFHAFAYISRGEQLEEKIGWINTSEQDISIRFIPREQSGLLQLVVPQVLPAGQRGELSIIYKVAADSPCYGTVNDVFDIEIDGKLSRTLFSTNAVAVDKFDRSNDDMLSPMARFTKKNIKFAEVKHSSVVTDDSLEIYNDGESDLIIRAIEYDDKILDCSLKAGCHIKAGKSVRVRLTLDTSTCDYGVWINRLRIVTNDPRQPMQSVRVTAIVVD